MIHVHILHHDKVIAEAHFRPVAFVEYVVARLRLHVALAEDDAPIVAAYADDHAEVIAYAADARVVIA